MPSFGIHIATANEVAKRIQVNKNDFILGNILPDALRGYMVPELSRIKRYQITHYSDEDIAGNKIINYPNMDLFLKNNIVENDVELGYFTHLLTDYYWNKKTIEAHGRDCNIKKQQDFAIFNKKLILKNNLDYPTYDETLIEKSKNILPITNEELSKIVKYFDNYKEKIDTNGDEKYQLFSKDDLENIYNECTQFVVKEIEKLRK